MSKDTEQSKSAEPHDDRWHYLDFEDKRHAKNYFEWKYFNFIGKGFEGYIMYCILDPEQKSDMGGGRLLVRILKDDKSYGLIKRIPVDKIEFDTVSAGVRMDGARIIEHDSHHYELLCDFPDISWNLNYKQDVPSIESFRELNTGVMKWEKNNWLIKMPKANVEGNIRIGNETFRINGLGYSDTNWSKTIPLLSKYEWGQYNDESFSLVFGVIYGFKNIKYKYFYIVLDKQVISLENAKCEIEHVEWKKDKNVGMKIPSKSSFFVRSGEYEIKFSTTLIHSDSPGIRFRYFLPASVVSEQIVEYEGVVLKNGVIMHKFKGRGFQEWLGKTWKKVSVAF